MLKKVPHTYVIVFFIIILAALITWVVPGGAYERQTVSVEGTSRSVIVEGSYHPVENNPQTWQVFAALFMGFERQAGIIVFILMIGGAFWLMNQTKAIDVGILSFLRFTRGLERNKVLHRLGVDNIILTLIMLVFSIFGAVFGMSEETIAFIIILVPLAISMGYDSITGVAIVFVAAGLGFAGAVLNPFTIGIAQGLSDLPLFSGFQYRMLCWLIINVVGIVYILRYAHKVKKNPKKSPVYDDDAYWRKQAGKDVGELHYFTPHATWVSYGLTSLVLVAFSLAYPESRVSIGRHLSLTFPALPLLSGIFIITAFLGARKSVHFYILTLLAFTIIFLIIGVLGHGWYVMEIATLFFGMGLASGLAYGFSANDIVKHFLDGVKDITGAALVVGLAGGIIIILENGRVIDSILHSLAGLMEDAGKFGSVAMMYLIQNVINIIIPSGSAKAALTMPIMAPFSDVIGISRQATVMAYQFGDGFTNLITPTSGVLIGVLGVARIPYDKWFRWVWPLIALLLVLGLLLLVPTVSLPLAGF